jgi:hypothetical protein
VKAAGKPGPPVLSMKSCSETSIEILWTASEDDGGCPITGYIVSWKLSTFKTYTEVVINDAKTLTYKLQGP